MYDLNMLKTRKITITKKDAKNAGSFWNTGYCLLATVGKRLFPKKIVSAGGSYFRVRNGFGAPNRYYTLPQEIWSADEFYDENGAVKVSEFPKTLTFTITEEMY